MKTGPEMSQVVILFANGMVFFIGLGCTVVASLLRALVKQSLAVSVIRIFGIFGAILVILSSAPFPIWVYAVWFALFTGTLLCSGVFPRGTRITLLICFCILSAVLCLSEVRYHFTPSLAIPRHKQLCVIGDSLSAPIRRDDHAWPDVLAGISGVTVMNLAVPGNTTKGALDEAKTIRGIDCSVLIEIGGNDLLGDMSADAFSRQLQTLLKEVCVPGRYVAMFELPLPMFKNGFSRAQRSLAMRYGVQLIPKRYMTKVLGTPGCTTDGLHFSQAGHDLMARSLLPIMTEGH